MNQQAVRQDCRRYVEQVLQAFRASHATESFTGLALECDPSVASLYIHLHTGEVGNRDAASWRFTYVEQEVGPIAEPGWFAEFNALQQRWKNPPREDILALAATLDVPRPDDAGVADLLGQPQLYAEATVEPEGSPLLVFFADAVKEPEFTRNAEQTFQDQAVADLARRHFRCRRVDLATKAGASLGDRYGAYGVSYFSPSGQRLGMFADQRMAGFLEHLQLMVADASRSPAEKEAEKRYRKQVSREVDAAFQTILRGAAAALAELERDGVLARLGFARGSVLAVVTEDDDSTETARERVAEFRH